MKLDSETEKYKRNKRISKTFLHGHQGHLYPAFCYFCSCFGICPSAEF